MIDNNDASDAMLLIENGKYEEAYQYLMSLENFSQPQNIACLAWLHESGKISSSNLEYAKELYQKLIDINQISGYNGLGRILFRLGNNSEARVILEKGAKLGGLSSMYYIGKILIQDDDPKSIEKGLSWWKEAQNQGHLRSKKSLAKFKFDNEKILFNKLPFYIEYLYTGLMFFREYIRDPYSEKLS